MSEQSFQSNTQAELCEIEAATEKLARDEASFIEAFDAQSSGWGSTSASMPGSSPTGVAPVLKLHPTRRRTIADIHCDSGSGPTVRGELPLGLLSDCVDAAAELGYRRLAVSGGEPLLYSSLPVLLARARETGMLTTLTTNGMLLTPRRWKQLAGFVDVLAISIDGTPDEHDLIRHREGAFARTVANLEVARAWGGPFGFIFTLTQYNVDSLEFVVRLAAAEGAGTVQVQPLTLYGRAEATMAGARPDEIELAAALCEAAMLGRELGVVVHVDALTADQLLEHRELLVPQRPVSRLIDVAPVLIVDADGIVIPMTHDVRGALRLGSLHEDGLAALAAEWLEAGGADELAMACEQAWADLTSTSPPLAVYWEDEVAARTWAGVPLRRTLELVPALR